VPLPMMAPRGGCPTHTLQHAQRSLHALYCLGPRGGTMAIAPLSTADVMGTLHTFVYVDLNCKGYKTDGRFHMLDVYAIAEPCNTGLPLKKRSSHGIYSFRHDVFEINNNDDELIILETNLRFARSQQYLMNDTWISQLDIPKSELLCIICMVYL
jgi:hypothetical protein